MTAWKVLGAVRLLQLMDSTVLRAGCGCFGLLFVLVVVVLTLLDAVL